MKTTISAILAALCLVVASSTSNARGPYGSLNVGNWHGGAYTNDKSGSFSHCAAGATYQSGIYFVVSVGEDYSWRLGFAHENWQLTPGQAFALALTFDGQPAINVQGLPIGSRLVNVDMPANSSLIACATSSTISPATPTMRSFRRSNSVRKKRPSNFRR